MRKLLVFQNVTLDAYFTDPQDDMSWAHNSDPEWLEFVSGNAGGESEMLFGRITYDMMANYWPSPHALENNPVVATHMNKQPKVVFSRTLDEASWSNTRLVNSDPAAEVRRMKEEDGPGMVIFGSGTIVALLAQAGLVDEYQIVVHPIVLGGGRSMFEGVKEQMALKLMKARVFENGNVLLRYEPA